MIFSSRSTKSILWQCYVQSLNSPEWEKPIKRLFFTLFRKACSKTRRSVIQAFVMSQREDTNYISHSALRDWFCPLREMLKDRERIIFLQVVNRQLHCALEAALLPKEKNNSLKQMHAFFILFFFYLKCNEPMCANCASILKASWLGSFLLWKLHCRVMH